jgi:hypothetical protein
MSFGEQVTQEVQEAAENSGSGSSQEQETLEQIETEDWVVREL